MIAQTGAPVPSSCVYSCNQQDDIHISPTYDESRKLLCRHQHRLNYYRVNLQYIIQIPSKLPIVLY